MKLRGLVPNFHIHVSMSDLYIPTIGPPILQQQNTVDGEYINRSPIYEGRNWELGRTVSFQGIYVSNFRYSFFAVHGALLESKCVFGPCRSHFLSRKSLISS
jgi:hypothetical protein